MLPHQVRQQQEIAIKQWVNIVPGMFFEKYHKEQIMARGVYLRDIPDTLGKRFEYLNFSYPDGNPVISGGYYTDNGLEKYNNDCWNPSNWLKVYPKIILPFTETIERVITIGKTHVSTTNVVK